MAIHKHNHPDMKTYKIKWSTAAEARAYHIFSIKPPGRGLFISSTLGGGLFISSTLEGGLIREGGLIERGGLINLTEYCRCDSISLLHLISSPLMRRTRIFSFHYSQYHAILNKNCFEKYNKQWDNKNYKQHKKIAWFVIKTTRNLTSPRKVSFDTSILILLSPPGLLYF